MIKFTEAAIAAIREKTAAKPGAAGLRLSIKSTGCSGNSYKMEYAMEEDLPRMIKSNPAARRCMYRKSIAGC